MNRRSGWDWLPIPAFLLEHPGVGPILIDAGLHPSCAKDVAGNMGRAGKLLYQVRMDHDQALRVQLPEREIQTRDIKVVVLTHLHIDHASAVSEFPDSTFVVDGHEWESAAKGGTLRGYHPRQFDHAFDWRTLDYRADPVESFAGFAASIDLFGDGSVRVVSTRGHTLGHQSVIVRTNERELLILGDAAYTEPGLRGQAVPFQVEDEHLYRRSLKEVRQYLEQTPDALVIPSHDYRLWPELQSVYGSRRPAGPARNEEGES